ncbi:hypothetical protein RIF29_36043 [Crotalaria pallida]|uniref:Uncharacterized protein n=1 Tax=Crotalaria pallida TaxID=3830 RepID=A0AAN9HUD4_CROPI
MFISLSGSRLCINYANLLDYVLFNKFEAYVACGLGSDWFTFLFRFASQKCVSQQHNTAVISNDLSSLHPDSSIYYWYNIKVHVADQSDSLMTARLVEYLLGKTCCKLVASYGEPCVGGDSKTLMFANISHSHLISLQLVSHFALSLLQPESIHAKLEFHGGRLRYLHNHQILS